MAVELQHGDYALQQGNTKKNLIHLKLTDSALRAIELYQDELKAGVKAKPSICFEGNQGIIRIPSNERNEAQNFTFQLSALNQSASIDCLQQYFTRDHTSMVSVLGEIQQKITVNAKDDSYNMTKKRIEIAKELEKNTSTKVIKQPGQKLHKKQALRRQILNPKQGRPSIASGRTSTPPPGRSNPFPRSASPMSHASRSVSPLSSGGDLAGVRNKTKPILSSLSSKPSTATVPSGKSLHERILHYIAIRPIRFADLVTRLNRSATIAEKSKVQNVLQQISEYDHQMVSGTVDSGSILNQIATSQSVRPGVNEFTLSKNFFNEVQPDWSGYTDEERVLVKRKLAEQNRATSDGRKRLVSDVEAPTKSSPNSTKQAVAEESYSNPVKKKARVSLYHKTSPHSQRPRSTSPLEGSTPMLVDAAKSGPLLNSGALVNLKQADVNKLGLPPSSGSQPKRPSSANSNSKINSNKRISPLTTSLPPLSDSFTSATFSTVKCDGNEAKEYTPVDTASPLESLTGQDKESSDSVPSIQSGDDVHADDDIPLAALDPLHSSSDDDEFIGKYQPINFPHQRDEYKSDFSAEYKEYLALHQKVLSKLKRFSEWQNELSQQERDTMMYKKIARQVYEEYMLLKQDKKFHVERKRRDYLHRKLKYIKQLVLEYDSKQFARHQVSRRDGTKSGNAPHRRANDVRQKRAVLTA